MMSNRLTRCFIGCLLILGVSSTHAITLADYVADVINKHPDVRRQVHYYRQVVQDTVIAYKGWHPTIDLNITAGEYTSSSLATNFISESYNAGQVKLTLNYNLFNGLNTVNQIEQNEARLYSAMYEVYDTIDNTALEAVKAYVELIKQTHLVELAEKNVESHNRILSHIKERSESGVGRISEVEQTEGRVARAHAGLIAQQNNYQDALSTFHKILGRYYEGVELAEPGLLERPGNDLEQVISETLKIHPALKVAKFNEDASYHDYQRAKSKYFPTLDLQAQKIVGDDTDSGSDNRVSKYSIVLSLNMNLYNGRNDMADKRKKASVIYENKAYFDLVKRQVMDRLRLAWVADLGIQKELYYLNQQLRRAKKTVELYREEFYIGQRDLLDLLDAENELNTAEIRLIESRYDGYAAVYRIHEGVGRLLEPLGLKVLLSAEDLTIEKVKIEDNQVDVIPYPIDHDKDVVRDDFDHCDNSLAYEDVNRYGCRKRIPINYGYKKPVAPQIEHINFKFDTVELTAESMKKVDEILLQLDKYPLAEIEFYAHTDELGKKEYNEELSERRARAILQLLIDRGVDGRRIKAIGMGESNPIADNATRSGQAKNRRGEFRIILY